MKNLEDFSDAAVLKRSQKAAQELAVASRSAKVKRELDNARMEKKERRPLKEFTDFRTEISEHVGVPAHSMPPNILILRRKTIRQFPNNVMVALYYNDKLGQYFSIPYGGVAADETVITPVALKEEEGNKTKWFGDNASLKFDKTPSPKSNFPAEHEAWLAKKKQTTKEFRKNQRDASISRPRGGASAALQRSQHSRGHLNEEHQVGDTVRYRLGAEGHLRVAKVKKMLTGGYMVVDRGGFHYKVPTHTVVHNERTGYTREELNEDAISHLQKVKAFATDKPLYHKDGSQTKVDPTTANALLTVHGALHPDNRKKFADALEHSQPKFHKMLDFAWRQVK